MYIYANIFTYMYIKYVYMKNTSSRETLSEKINNKNSNK